VTALPALTTRLSRADLQAREALVPGLWLASSYGGFGGLAGAMTGALAALRAQT
jgi:hypothetical protein